MFRPGWRCGVLTRVQLAEDNLCAIINRRSSTLVSELSDPVGQSGYLTARRFLVDDAGASRPHESGLGGHQSRRCGGLISARDGVFDVAQRSAHARAPRLIHFSAARDLARGLFGRFGVGHRSVPGFASVILGNAALSPAQKSGGEIAAEMAPLIVG